MKFLVNCNLVRYVRTRKANGQLGPVSIHVLNGSEFTTDLDPSQTASICILDEDPSNSAPQRKKTTLQKATHVDDCAHINKINNKNKINNIYNLPSAKELKNPHSVPIPLIEAWLKLKAKRKSPVKPDCWEKMLVQLDKCADLGKDPVEAFEIMVGNGWIYLDADKIRVKNLSYLSPEKAKESRKKALVNQIKMKYQEYIGRIKHDIMLGLAEARTAILSFVEWLSCNPEEKKAWQALN